MPMRMVNVDIEEDFLEIKGLLSDKELDAVCPDKDHLHREKCAGVNDPFRP